MLHILLVITLLITGCSYGAQTSYQEGRDKFFSDLRGIRSGAEIELIGRTDQNSDAYAKELSLVSSKVFKNCDPIYSGILHSNVHRIAGSNIAVNKIVLTDIMREADASFSNCAKQFGAKAEYYLVLNGNDWKNSEEFLEWFFNTGNSLIQMRDSAMDERENNIAMTQALVTALAAGNSKSVSSYQGNCRYHWQTASDGSNCGARSASSRPGGY